MPKYEPVPPISGADALLTLLEVVKDAKRVEARVKELMALRDEINASIERAGQAENIPALHEAAQKDRQAAADTRRTAHEEAASIVKTAYASRDAAMKEAEESRRLAKDARAAMTADRTAWEQERTSRQNAVAALEHEVKDKLTVAASAQQEAEMLKAEWQEKIDRLKSAGVILGVPA